VNLAAAVQKGGEKGKEERRDDAVDVDTPHLPAEDADRLRPVGEEGKGRGGGEKTPYGQCVRDWSGDPFDRTL